MATQTDEFVNLADQRVEAVGHERSEAGQGRQAATPRGAGFATATRRVGPYGLGAIIDEPPGSVGKGR